LTVFAFPLRTLPTPEGLVDAMTLEVAARRVNAGPSTPVDNHVDKSDQPVDGLWMVSR
jgi:hypothetical protein